MKSQYLWSAFVFFFCTSVPVFSDDPCHFIPSAFTRDEERILALAGVKPEFKCDYELSPMPKLKESGSGKLFTDGTFQLFAEVYSGTTCIARYRLAYAVTSDDAPKIKGVISIGWKESSHQLTGVVDNDERYSPWTTGAVTLPQFSTHPTSSDFHFFDTSLPELRHSPTSGDVTIFPVLGIRGTCEAQFGSKEGIATAADFLNRCKTSGAKNAVIIYISKGTGDLLPYNKGK